MKMSFRNCLKSWAIALLASGFLLPSSYALDFSLLGATTISNYSVTPTVPTSSGVAFGAGATAGMSLNPFFSLESGLLFMSHSFSATLGPAGTDVTYNYLDIPLIVRFNPIAFISVGAGAYCGIATSNTVKTGSTVTNPALTNDFGLLATAGVRWPLAPLLKVRLDVMYEHGLANLATVASTQNSRNVDILAGLMLDIW